MPMSLFFFVGLDYVRTNLVRTVKTAPEGLTHQYQKWFALFGGHLSLFGAYVSVPWCHFHSSHKIRSHLIFSVFFVCIMCICRERIIYCLKSSTVTNALITATHMVLIWLKFESQISRVKKRATFVAIIDPFMTVEDFKLSTIISHMCIACASSLFVPFKSLHLVHVKV